MAVAQKVRTIALPVVMIMGGVLYELMDKVSWLPPYLIFTMLFITFTRVSAREIRIQKLHLILLALQLLGGMSIYFMLEWLDIVVAQGMMMSVFAPSAMASVVVSGLLGANITTVAVFCLLSNVSVAFISPVFFTMIGANPDMSFWSSVIAILSKVGVLLVVPFVLSWILEKISPRLHATIARNQDISFWIWLACMAIVTGSTVKFIILQPSTAYTDMVILAVGSLVLCWLQFRLGWYFGKRNGDRVAGGQSLGQKNNVLVIWMSQTYLDPLSSIAPALYVVWQNTINSWQLARYKK